MTKSVSPSVHSFRGLRRASCPGRALATAAGVAITAAALAACGGDVGSVVSGGDPAPSNCPAHPAPTINDGFPEPPVRTSRDGVLETTLRASYGPVTLNGRTYATMHYEKSVPGPTLVVCPGDRLIVHLENDLGGAPPAWSAGGTEHAHHGGQLTNLHTHGLHVSPRGRSDNVFLSIPPGEDFTYEYEIPEDHPPGMYWYHPHRHGLAESQVYAGMLGVIYVQGGLDEVPELRDVPTRTMVITSLQLGDRVVVPVEQSETEKSPYFLNGTLNPNVRIRPGELQRWRILNANDNAIVRLALEDHELYVLANDGNTVQDLRAKSTLLLGPGERREVLVRGGAEGIYHLESLAFSQFQGGKVPTSTIATITSTGPGANQVVPQDPLDPDVEDLRNAEVDQRHRIVFAEKEVGKDEFEFLLNGKTFNEHRVDAVMTLGEVNEWVLVNHSTEWHTFHIHVNDFQVIAYTEGHVKDVSAGEVEDVHPSAIDLEDTVLLPPGAKVIMRTRPTDFTGKFVFHCHMLFHEDNGMMGVVRVER